MFTPPRFVVVDDNPDHLTAILDVFQKLGTPCLGVTYDAEQELDKQNFKSVRALFLDLHLTDGGATTDNRPHFAIIARLLEDNISPAGGPFILVVWTGYEHEVKGLMDYLDEAGAIDSEKPHARPLAVGSSMLPVSFLQTKRMLYVLRYKMRSERNPSSRHSFIGKPTCRRQAVPPSQP